MAKITEDREIRRFIRQSAPPETFTHLAAELRRRFDLDLSAEAASHLWRAIRRPRPGAASRFERNPVLMAFIADRADLMTIDQLRARVARAFGLASTPSRSQLFRLVQLVRDRAQGSFKDAGGS